MKAKTRVEIFQIARRAASDLSRKTLALCLIITASNLAAGVAAVSRAESSAGVINVIGGVRINDVNGLSGQTIFGSSRIVTAKDAESLITFRNHARIKLSEETELTLNVSPAALAGSLTKGSIQAQLPAGLPVHFETGDFAIDTDTAEPATLSLHVEDCVVADLSVQNGIVSLRTGNGIKTLSAGEHFSTLNETVTSAAAPQNFSHRKRVGLIAGISAAVAVLLIVFVGRDHEVAAPGGCIDLLSGQSNCR